MGKKILIVDEDKEIRKMLTELLKTDYTCIPAQNSREGVYYLDNNIGETDLIIMNLQMSEMNGFELLEKIENNPNHRNIPVLVIISLEQTEDITHVFHIGADDIISKPLNHDIVKKRVDNMLNVGGNRMVHNVMEDLIQAEIDECIGDLGICTCPVCRRDLLTLTLNHVAPKYVTSEKGAAITKAERTASRDEKLKLLTEIAYYAQLVKQKPHHR